MQKMDGPWWRGLQAPTPLDSGQRLARHYAAEVRLAHGLTQDAESLARYPHAQVRVVAAAERARGRAQRVRRALGESGHPAAEPTTRSGRIEPAAWDGLSAAVSELGSMSEACLADAHAVEREHPGIADLLYDLHRETAGDRRDVIWILAQLAGTAVKTMASEEVAA